MISLTRCLHSSVIVPKASCTTSASPLSKVQLAYKRATAFQFENATKGDLMQAKKFEARADEYLHSAKYKEASKLFQKAYESNPKDLSLKHLADVSKLLQHDSHPQF